MKELERALEDAKGKIAAAQSGDLAAQARDVNGAKVLAVRVEGDGVPEGRGGRRGRIERSVTTPFPPPGAELARVATISDLHVGETTFGYLHTIGESVGTPVDESHSIRAARAGIAEALAWGAQRLVLKGDIVDQSHPGHWREVEKLLADVPVPMHVIAGNHEVKRRRTIEPADALADSVAAYTDTVDAIDLGGTSLVLVNSTEPDHERGRLSHLQGDLLGALGSAPGGALVALHHHLRHGRNPGAWPVGVPAYPLVPALFVWQAPHGIAWVWLGLCGLLGTIGQLLWTRALKLGEVSALTPISFVQLPIVTLAGWLLFAEQVDGLTLLGAAIILSATFYIAHREALLARRAASQAPSEANPPGE